MKTLAQLKCGECATIVAIYCKKSKERLLDLGLTCGAKVQVVHIAPLKSPVKIQVRGYFLLLRKKQLKDILVEEIK